MRKGWEKREKGGEGMGARGENGKAVRVERTGGEVEMGGEVGRLSKTTSFQICNGKSRYASWCAHLRLFIPPRHL